MKARPILFNTDMVKAILAGQKTQTRREAKNIVAAPRFRSGWKAVRPDGKAAISTDAPAGLLGEACPFGYPGDLLYVRETWSGTYGFHDWKPSERKSVMTPDGPQMREEIWYWADGCPEHGDWEKPRPSIHMPRWASRLTLEITDVRVERLQAITKEDAAAEGFNMPPIPGQDWKFGARHNFKFTWNSIYGNWDANPWVWVVEFKAHHCNVDALLREREAA